MSTGSDRFVISERQEDGTFIVSFRCDECDYALTRFHVLETEVAATNNYLESEMPSRHRHRIDKEKDEYWKYWKR